ncbi:MAG: CPBP family intramembrane metalloprotease [Maritimibacter sp.]|nr:CPBP family intramembrane metalloprotease [Maritimibacter sp.]
MTDPAFWQPAEARPQLWRTALGVVVTAVVWIALGFLLVWLASKVSDMPPAMAMDATTWSGSAMFFLTFLGLHVGLAIALRLLHGRGYSSLFGPRHALDRHHLVNGALVMLAMATGLYAFMGVENLILPEGVPPPIHRLRATLDWLPGLVPALALILLQVSAEELAFRGYLLQQLRARFHSPLVWAIAPALVFGALHFDPDTYGPVNATAYVLNATIMGALAAFVTLRTGNLGAAIGLHFGNNASLVLVGLDGQLAGFSLFSVAMDPASGYATYSIVAQTLVALAIFGLWWRWMNRHRPIANAAAPA